MRAKIDSTITGYGQESRNRSTRQQVPNKVWTDENEVEHEDVYYYMCSLLRCDSLNVTIIKCNHDMGKLLSIPLKLKTSL